MTEQTSLWQDDKYSADFSEVCNALYERELHLLCQNKSLSVESLQGRLKSLPYYVKRTAFAMTQAQTPLVLDSQNASWSAKQSKEMPLAGQSSIDIESWYNKHKLSHGLVLPIVVNDHITLDCIDRIDSEKQRFRTNIYGWFDLEKIKNANPNIHLLKPNKKVMMAACSGHCWQGSKKLTPKIPSLRELLLSCSINWRNFAQPRQSYNTN